MSNRDLEYNFTVVDDNGNEVICDVISVLQDTKNNGVYVVYTDYTLNENNQFNTYLSELVEKKGEFTLKTITSKLKYEELLETAKTVYGRAISDLLGTEE
jgi:uncharacterized protein YrzB (UPF0473 family)